MGWGTWAGLGNVFNSLGEELGSKRLEGQYRREDAERRVAKENRDIADYTYNKDVLRPLEEKRANLGIQETEGNIKLGGLQRQREEEVIKDLPEVRRQRDAAFNSAQALAESNRIRQDLENEWYPKLTKQQIETSRAAAAASGRGARRDQLQGDIAALELEEARQQNTPEAKAWAMAKPLRDASIAAMNDADDMVKRLGSAMDPDAIGPYMEAARTRAQELRQQAYEEYEHYYQTYGGKDPANLTDAARRLRVGATQPSAASTGSTSADRMGKFVEDFMK